MCIREKYNILQEGKILLYVGNISRNKNQRQMVNAFNLLPEDLQQNIWVLFCGNEDPSCGVETQIANSKYSSHLILCGGVKREILPEYYKAADVVVLLSISEGFGLSLIEGMHFGKPCVTFEDLPAFEDIYNPNCVVGIPNRNDLSVAHALETSLHTNWDSNEIVSFSEIFNQKSMAKKYLAVYREILCKD